MAPLDGNNLRDDIFFFYFFILKKLKIKIELDNPQPNPKFDNYFKYGCS